MLINPLEPFLDIDHSIKKTVSLCGKLIITPSNRYQGLKEEKKKLKGSGIKGFRNLVVENICFGNFDV